MLYFQAVPTDKHLFDRNDIFQSIFIIQKGK